MSAAAGVKCMKALFLIIVLVVVAYWFWPRSNYAGVEEMSKDGQLIDLPKYFNLYQSAASPYEMLIISAKGSEEFVQFSREGSNVEIDFPLVTENQKSLESKFRKTCERQGLEIREVFGSDDTLFLDADLPPSTEERAKIIKNILIDVFDITESEKLQFTYF